MQLLTLLEVPCGFDTIKGEIMSQLTPLEMMVKTMLGQDEIPESLWDTLMEVGDMCQKVGGNLHSRQAVAHIIYQWRKEQE